MAEEKKVSSSVGDVSAAMLVAHVALLTELRLSGAIDPTRLSKAMFTLSDKLTDGTISLLELFSRVGLEVTRSAEGKDG